MDFTTRTEFGITKIFINGDQIVASFSSSVAGAVAAAIFTHGLASIPGHALTDAVTGKVIVGTLDQLVEPGPFQTA